MNGSASRSVKRDSQTINSDAKQNVRGRQAVMFARTTPIIGSFSVRAFVG